MQQWWTGLANASPHDASALHALGLGFMAAKTLCVALEFQVFSHLAEKTLSLAQLALALNLTERATSRLLYACAALGLIQSTAQGFRNTPIAERYLVQDRPTYIGSYLQMFDTLGYHRWEQMSTALRHDAPPDTVHHPYRYLADDKTAAEDFMLAQHTGSISLGHALARRFDFRPYTCLLDLGGGSGAYSTAILQRYPHMRAIIFDFPQVCRIAEATAREVGLTHRITTVAGDYERDALPQGPDVVLWSGNLHASSPTRCLQVIQRIAARLPVDGALLIHDYLLDDSRCGPLIPALLALHLTLVSDDGQVYSAHEIETLLTTAGFTDIVVQPFLAGHSGLVSARKASA
jgi:hypothetical protein